MWVAFLFLFERSRVQPVPDINYFTEEIRGIPHSLQKMLG
jgi:hypothetical protein